MSQTSNESEGGIRKTLRMVAFDVRKMVAAWVAPRGLSLQPHTPYGDLILLGIDCEGAFKPKDWEGNPVWPPTISGKCRSRLSFRPTRLVVTEIVLATFSNEKLGDRTVAARIQEADDVVLGSIHFGALNALPNVPHVGHGIAGPTFSSMATDSLMPWPIVPQESDVVVSLAIERSVLDQVLPPEGYSRSDLSELRIKVRMNFSGLEVTGKP